MPMPLSHHDRVCFYINDEAIEIQQPKPTQSLLSYLREVQRLTGTKEGCNEGDCGACSVVIADLHGDQLRFRAINACIVFLPMINGSAIYTIEYLAKSGKLHPIQQGLVASNGAQCGFCTPGIIMSLYAWSLNNPQYNKESIENALQGNLCRCTGYRSIIEGILNAEKAIKAQAQVPHFADQIQLKLEALAQNPPYEWVEDDLAVLVPHDVEALQSGLARFPNARLVNGATDVGLWVNKQGREFSQIIFLSNLAQKAKISADEKEITIDAFMTISDAELQLAPYFPDLDGFWKYFAGKQVRNSASLGGNIANASPIGDSLPLWLALDAEITLLQAQGTRRIRLEEFFIDYGQTDLQTGECVYQLHIPRAQQGKLRFYKVSKRKYEDISSVFGAIKISQEAGLITQARLAFGGMAGTPQRALSAEDCLKGKPFSRDVFQTAISKISESFSPLSDHRASAEYRMKTAQNMLWQYFLDETGS